MWDETNESPLLLAPLFLLHKLPSVCYTNRVSDLNLNHAVSSSADVFAVQF